MRLKSGFGVARLSTQSIELNSAFRYLCSEMLTVDWSWRGNVLRGEGKNEERELESGHVVLDCFLPLLANHSLPLMYSNLSVWS